jgi:hypothetical protein
LPGVVSVVPLSAGEKFSEIWVLGSDRLIGSVPFIVSPGKAYTVYLDVGNHMGELEYYAVHGKIRNQSEPLPDDAGRPSPLLPVFEFRMFSENNEILERRLDFSFQEVSFEGNTCRISGVLLNGYKVNVNKIVVWDTSAGGFYFQFFFELWIYESAMTGFQFHNRYVQFWLNMTSES